MRRGKQWPRHEKRKVIVYAVDSDSYLPLNLFGAEKIMTSKPNASWRRGRDCMWTSYGQRVGEWEKVERSGAAHCSLHRYNESYLHNRQYHHRISAATHSLSLCLFEFFIRFIFRRAHGWTGPLHFIAILMFSRHFYLILCCFIILRCRLDNTIRRFAYLRNSCARKSKYILWSQQLARAQSPPGRRRASGRTPYQGKDIRMRQNEQINNRKRRLARGALVFSQQQKEMRRRKVAVETDRKGQWISCAKLSNTNENVESVARGGTSPCLGTRRPRFFLNILTGVS